MGVNKELGPDNEESPHKLASPQNVEYPATAENIRSTAGLEFLCKIFGSVGISPLSRSYSEELPNQHLAQCGVAYPGK